MKKILVAVVALLALPVLADPPSIHESASNTINALCPTGVYEMDISANEQTESYSFTMDCGSQSYMGTNISYSPAASEGPWDACASEASCKDPIAVSNTCAQYRAVRDPTRESQYYPPSGSSSGGCGMNCCQFVDFGQCYGPTQVFVLCLPEPQFDLKITN